jgi:hypothetical protein
MTSPNLTSTKQSTNHKVIQKNTIVSVTLFISLKNHRIYWWRVQSDKFFELLERLDVWLWDWCRVEK